MKKFVAMSAIAAMAVMGNAATDAEELAKLKEELSTLKETVKEIKIHDAGDNVKFSVNLRTAVDSIESTRASGSKDSNGNLMTNRLMLNMSAQPAENLTFNGALSYNKAFGASPADSSGMPQRGYGYDAFDWVINENLIDNSIRVKEASWFYYGNVGVPMVVSVGRRPSTDGFGANYREGASKAKSPQAHSINVEYDGASIMFKDLTDFGTSFKICAGRGLTNARSRFNMEGGFTSYGDYTESDVSIKSVDMYGLIVVPYDDGQYKLSMMPFKATNLPGFNMMTPAYLNSVVGAAQTNSDATQSFNNTGMVALNDMYDSDSNNSTPSYWGLNEGVQMASMGDMTGLSVSFQAYGIGDGISDFLDDTTFFASWAMSKTSPNNNVNVVDMVAFNDALIANNMTLEQAIAAVANGQMDPSGFVRKSGMLGSTDEETGTSIWVGLTIPAMFTDNGRLGFEYNHGSEYWRSMTYGEDTLAASKIAARGSAVEAYYNQPLVDDYLKMQIRYTAINYEYTGSQGFFGDDGMPLTMDEAEKMGMDPVESVSDLRFSITYDY